MDITTKQVEHKPLFEALATFVKNGTEHSYSQCYKSKEQYNEQTFREKAIKHFNIK